MRLRKLKEKDAPLMLEWMHDDYVVHDLKANFVSKTMDDCINFIECAQETKGNIHLAIVDEEDEYMGTVSLKHIKNNNAEFGITIRRCAMGKGYSSYAMKQIIKIAYEEMKLDKIYWCVSPNNKRACRFYDRNGYSRCDIPAEADAYTKEEKEKYVWYTIALNDWRG